MTKRIVSGWSCLRGLREWFEGLQRRERTQLRELAKQIDVEPLPDDHPLWSYENVVLTPHTAGASPLRMQRCVDLVCENLRRDLAGEPLLCVIDKRLGY